MDNEDFNRDSEFFNEKMSPKEQVIWNLQTNSSFEPDLSRSLDIDDIDIGMDPFELDENVTIIRTSSEPNLKKFPIKSYSLDANDSFLVMENEVAQLCKTYRNPDSNEVFNNSFELVDYILKRGPNNELKQESKEAVDEIKKLGEEKAKLIVPCETAEPEIVLPTIQIVEKTLTQIKKPPLAKNEQLSPSYGKRLKLTLMNDKEPAPSHGIIKSPLPNTKQLSPSFGKSLKSPLLKHKQVSPSLEKNVKSPILKKSLTVQKTQVKHGRSTKRNLLYGHINSPIAAYIKRSPRVPLVKDIRPMKPLPSTSSTPSFTPKSVKTQMHGTHNIKENVQLPLVAYKSAIKTEVITVPDKKKFPPSEWVKQFTSKNKPTVIKHAHREMATTSSQALHTQATTLVKEESYADLPLNQAELSVCQQKSAFKPL